MPHVDVAIIGASFAGIAAALQLARASRRVKLYDTDATRNRFAGSAHGFIGHDGRPPQQLKALGLKDLGVYPTVELVPQAVSRISKNGTVFEVEAKGSGCTADRVILAYGVRDILPDIPGMSEAWGEGVVHCPYCHGYELRGKRLGVLHTSDMSIHQLQVLSDWSDDLVYFTNGNTIDDCALNDIRARGYTVVGDVVTSLALEGKQVRAVVHRGGVTDVAALYIITATVPSSSLAADLGCEFDQGPFGPFVAVNGSQQTSIDGLYAAGDLTRPKHNATFAAADGVNAGISTHQSLLAEKWAAGR